jgi:hypothetical protein
MKVTTTHKQYSVILFEPAKTSMSHALIPGGVIIPVDEYLLTNVVKEIDEQNKPQPTDTQMEEQTR